jgi:hypothetical protein
MPNQVDRDFSGDSAWADVDLAAGGGAYDETGDLTITAGGAGAGDYCTCPVLSVPTTIGYKYRLRFDVANLVGTWTIKSFDGTQTIGTVSATGLQQAFEWIATTTGGLRLVAVSNNASGDFDNFILVKLGATLALEPEGINKVANRWYGGTSNHFIANLPPLNHSNEIDMLKTTDTVLFLNGGAGVSGNQCTIGDVYADGTSMYFTNYFGTAAGVTCVKVY